jgi:hypothetical protein
MTHRTILKTIFEPFVIVVAAVYFVIDALALSILKPLLRKIANLKLFRFIAPWIASLGPYPTLALFMLPLVLLEPIKPFSAYIIASVGTLPIRHAGPCPGRSAQDYDCRTDFLHWTR